MWGGLRHVVVRFAGFTPNPGPKPPKVPGLSVLEAGLNV